MHEMSIAKSIVDIVSVEMSKAGEGQVTELELEIGQLSGIEYESLDFALKAVQPGTVIEGSTITISKPPGEALCNDCGHLFETDTRVSACPECKSYGCSIIGGKQLRVVSIVID